MIPIVFANLADPAGAGIVASLARPDGNTTGFTNYEYTMGGKWLEVLHETAPRVNRFAVLQAVNNPSLDGFMREIESAAMRLRVQVTAAPVRNTSDVEHEIEMLAREPNAGLIVLPDALMISQRDLRKVNIASNWNCCIDRIGEPKLSRSRGFNLRSFGTAPARLRPSSRR